jgi:hypothetical protein
MLSSWFHHYQFIVETTLLKAGEHVILTFNHTEFRDHFEIYDYSPGKDRSIEVAQTPQYPNSSMPSGTAYHWRDVGGKSFLLLLGWAPLLAKASAD